MSPPSPNADARAGNAGDGQDSNGVVHGICEDAPQRQVARFLRMLALPDSVFEIRAINVAEKRGSTFVSTFSGYYHFDQIERAARDIAELDSSGRAPAIYVTLNPVRPRLLGRALNELKSKAKSTTGDDEVVRRGWLLIDCDPVRPSGLSSTDAELSQARATAREVWTFLKDRGWAEPAVVMSGNGVHLLYRIDQPADDGGLVQRVLLALAARFSSDLVAIDSGVFNASRITKVPGTMARKGANLRGVAGVEDRPHRRAELLRVPDPVQIVPSALLEELAADATAVPGSARPNGAGTRPAAASADGTRYERFEHTPAGVRGYLERHGVSVKGEKRDGGATLLHLDRCPVKSDCASSGYSDISVIVGDDGKIAYRNLHNRGVGLAWIDVREALEPGYRAFAEAAKAGTGRTGASGGSVSAPPDGPPSSWPDPKPLPLGLTPVMPFNPEWLPAALRPWITDIADRIQCPIDFPAVAAMIAISALVGRKVGIRPKRHDDWLVVPNLWGGVIGRPGVMKTPAIQEPLKPLNRLEVLAKQEFDAQAVDVEAGKRVADVRKKSTDGEIKKNLKNPDEAFRIARESLDEEGDDPARKRYVVNDSTVEKLGEILNQNPFGVLVFRDELIGFLKGLDKQGQESARSFYLEAWNGTGRFAFDRIGRGTIDIEAAIVSILGGIQPGPLTQYLGAAAREGAGDDGLLQRFQLLVWPDIKKEWVNVDRWPNKEARERAREVFEGLDALEPDLIGADRDAFETGGIPFLRFDNEAQEVFDEWRAGLEGVVRSGELSPSLESHL